MKRCSSKLYASLLAVAVAVLVSLAPRGAEACGSGGGGGSLEVVGYTLLGVGVGLATADAVFTGYDLVQAVSEERASKGMATAEIAVAAPQLAIGALILSEMPRDNTMIVPAFYVAWMGVLTGHGIGTLMSQPPEAPSRGEPASTPKSDPKPAVDPDWVHPRMSITPTMMSDGVRTALMPGVSAVGTF